MTMLGALGTTLFFAITPVFASGAARRIGSITANFWRLLVASLPLAAWAHFAGQGLAGDALPWFALGGVVGFGIGGLAMFQSLPAIGATLSTLIVQCLTAIAAALAEWAWLGARPSAMQTGWIVLTLCGVVIGLLPRSRGDLSARHWRVGVAWAVLSACAQGAGAVISRKAFGIAAALHQPIDPGTAAYQRVLGGLAVAAVALAFARGERLHEPRLRSAMPWVLANALTGPVLGVTCYQWALRTTPAALVQPIVATAPLLTIPFAVWLNGAAAPRASYYIGTLLAVAGATGIVLAR